MTCIYAGFADPEPLRPAAPADGRRSVRPAAFDRFAARRACVCRKWLRNFSPIGRRPPRDERISRTGTYANQASALRARLPPENSPWNEASMRDAGYALPSRLRLRCCGECIARGSGLRRVFRIWHGAQHEGLSGCGMRTSPPWKTAPSSLWKPSAAPMDSGVRAPASPSACRCSRLASRARRCGAGDCRSQASPPSARRIWSWSMLRRCRLFRARPRDGPGP